MIVDSIFELTHAPLQRPLPIKLQGIGGEALERSGRRFHFPNEAIDSLLGLPMLLLHAQDGAGTFLSQVLEHREALGIDAASIYRELFRLMLTLLTKYRNVRFSSGCSQHWLSKPSVWNARATK